MEGATPFLALAAVLSLALPGCGRNEEAAKVAAKQLVAPEQPPAAEPPVASDSDAAPKVAVGPPPGPEVKAPAASGTAAAKLDELTVEQQINAGKALYATACASCHQPTGQGIPGAFPPLAKSDYIAANPKSLPEIIRRGQQGPVKVNGTDYNAVMPPMKQLSDDEVANISTYVLNSRGNPGGRVSKAEVAKIR